MRYQTPEISWHNKDPVLSIDMQPVAEDFYRLASGGTDTHVVIWYLRRETDEKYSIEAVSDLTKHQRSVNVVRWSPCSNYLASGDDDGNIILWHLKADELAVLLNEDTNKEKWSILKILRGHTEDVYDISWSGDSSKLVSASVDNTAIIWNVAKGTHENILSEHRGFVQGVSWDPLGKYIATLCSDRICRIYDANGKQVLYRISKGNVPVPDTHPLHDQVVRYYHDDTLKSYFRRLSFSPDGLLLITPSGLLEMEEGKIYASYIFTRNDLAQPAIMIPCPKKFTVAVRCCPLFFDLREDGPETIIDLPYRMIIAIATSTTVVLYDTQQTEPVALFSDLHYTRLTDLAWSPDARLLMVSSSDGFCTLITFKENELGTVYQGSIEPPSFLDETEEDIAEPLPVETPEKNTSEKEEEKKSSYIKQWALQGPKARKSLAINIDVDEVVEIGDDDDEDDGVKLMEPEVGNNEDLKSEKENNPRENTAPEINKENIKNEATSSENKLLQIETTSSKKKPRRITPAKVNSEISEKVAAKKPNRITPTKLSLENQKDIKKSAKSPKQPKREKKRRSKNNPTVPAPVTTLEVVEENARDTWNNDSQMAAKMNQPADTVLPEIITIEDSQDLKLVLEDTAGGDDKGVITSNSDKPHINTQIIEDSQEMKLVLEDTTNTATEASTSIQNCDEKNTEKPQSQLCDKYETEPLCKKIKVCTSKNNDEIRSSVSDSVNIPSSSEIAGSNNVQIRNNSNLHNVPRSSKNLDSPNIQQSMQVTQNSSSDVNQQKQPIKKRVPFYTLSSPKIKKKQSPVKKHK